MAHWLALLLTGMLAVSTVRAAEGATLEGLLRRADELDAKRDVSTALNLLEEAEARFPGRAEVLTRLAKQQSNLIFTARTDAEKKRLAALCLTTAERAVAADKGSARARLAVGICLAKNFPHVDNRTKVNYSRRLKEESERAIDLDPKLDLAYHMLARWHFEVAEMNSVLRGIAKLVYGGIPKGTLAEARKNFERAVALAPGRIIHRHQLAQTLLAAGQKSDAIEQLQRCLKLDPTDVDDAEAKVAAARQLKGFGTAATEPAASSSR